MTTRRIRRGTGGRALALAAALALGGPLACNTAPMLRPPPVATPLPAAKNRQIVLETLNERGWTIDSDEPGEIGAHYTKGSHVARIRISYDASDIRIAYVSSENLKCVPVYEGCDTIHRAYNRWVDNLYEDIRTRVQTASIQTPE